MDRPTYIASCSFGKDSIATILLAMLHHEPLDRIVSVEVMFDNARGISGEDPEHIQWVKEFAIPRLKELTGIDTDIVRNDRFDYMTAFYKVRGERSKHQGKMGGFLLTNRCQMNSRGKIEPLHKYFRQFENVVQYVGIAADEPVRLARLKGGKVSLLDKYGYTEQMAFNLCKQYDLLSPTYATATRGGCWFCPNRKLSEHCKLRSKHPELWQELQQMGKVDNTCGKFFNRSQTFAQLERAMDWHEKQLSLFDNL